MAAGRVSVGVDEVGRGCLAGPVVTAAVVMPAFMLDSDGMLDSMGKASWWTEINDSKLVPPAKRERLAAQILETCEVQIAWCYPQEIDRWNILHASLIAMRRALGPFSGLAQTVLVDGNQNPFEPRWRCSPGLAQRLGFTEIELLVKGDSRSISIAAASIVAKVYRDAWMVELDALLPGYSFGVHKGYSTPMHYEAIRKLGPCAIHRFSFEPFKSASPGKGPELCNSGVNGEESEPESESHSFQA